MKLLAAGFDSSANERLSFLFTRAGHQVLAASGEGAARTLARASRPDVLLVPGGPAGEMAASWVTSLLAGVAVVVLPADVDPEEALQALAALALETQPTEGVDAAAVVIETPASTAPVPAVEAPAAAPTTIEAPSPRPGPSAAPRTEPGPELASKLAQVRFGDYHAILQTTSSASPGLIREQHERLRALYTPTGWTQAVHAHDIPLLDEITRGVDDAFSILGDPELRTRYERALTQAAGRPASR